MSGFRPSLRFLTPYGCCWITFYSLQHPLPSPQVYDVIGLLYQYVAMLRREGPQDWVFRELQAIAKMDFRFAEEEEAEDYVVRVARESPKLLSVLIEKAWSLVLGDCATESCVRWVCEAIFFELESMLAGDNNESMSHNKLAF